MNDDLQMLKAHIWHMEQHLSEWEKDLEKAYICAVTSNQLLENIREELRKKIEIKNG